MLSYLPCNFKNPRLYKVAYTSLLVTSPLTQITCTPL